MAHALFHFPSRTTSVSVAKKQRLKGSRDLLGVAGGPGRRHTMLPQRERDSVLSNGSSDRSSSVSDENFLPLSTLPESSSSNNSSLFT